MVEAHLPVAVDLPRPLLDEVAAWVEADAGWQLVSSDGPPQPALLLTGAVQPGRRCVVVATGMPTAQQVRDGMRQGAVDVIGWPGERDRLRHLASVVSGPTSSHEARTLRIAGVSGGVGTSTVCLAVGAVLAWAGQRVVVAGDDDLLRLCGHAPWRGPGLRQIAALSPDHVGGEVQTLARPVTGVEMLSVLGGGGLAAGATAGWPVDVVIADVRSPASLDAVDLLIARPDGAVIRAADTGAPVVIVGRGPADRRRIQRLLGRAVLGWLPDSARVARAGLAGRVPSSLPGTWVAAMKSLVRGLGRGGGRTATS